MVCHTACMYQLFFTSFAPYNLKISACPPLTKCLRAITEIFNPFHSLARGHNACLTADFQCAHAGRVQQASGFLPSTLDALVHPSVRNLSRALPLQRTGLLIFRQGCQREPIKRYPGLVSEGSRRRIEILGRPCCKSPTSLRLATCYYMSLDGACQEGLRRL